jgi:integrase
VRTIRVTGTLKRRTGHGLVRDTPKTEHANRVVPLPAFSVTSLRSHRQTQRKERLRAGSMWQDTGYVFTSPIGTPLDPANVNKDFRALCETAKITPRRFHALRHSAATLMLANGASLEVISKTLGHAGLSITADIYARVAPKLQKQVADAMDRALLG